MACDKGCEKSEYVQTGESYSISSNSASSSENIQWMDPPRGKKCHKCKSPKGRCRCRFTNIKILPCLPAGAIPINSPKSVCECRRVGCGGCGVPKCGPVLKTCGRIQMQVPVNPLEQLVGLDSGLNNGYIMIQMQCSADGVIIFQWESFQGIIGANNIKEVTMNATLGNLPIYPVEFPIRIQLAGDFHTGYFSVKNMNGPKVYQFHFKNSEDLKAKIGDSITVYGSCVTWLTCQ